LARDAWNDRYGLVGIHFSSTDVSALESWERVGTLFAGQELKLFSNVQAVQAHNSENTRYISGPFVVITAERYIPTKIPPYARNSFGHVFIIPSLLG